MSILRAFLRFSLVIAVLAVAAPSHAGSAESGAKDAMVKAAADYATGGFERALARLDKALRGCGEANCTMETRGQLLLSRGVMLARTGDSNDAVSAFTESLSVAPDLTLPKVYDVPSVRAAFIKAKQGGAQGQPTEGDFSHTPWTEQRAKTPLPVYVEYDGVVSKVVVRYLPAGEDSWKRVDLHRMGSGWAGVIPCADMEEGVLRYYVQGLDEDDLPIATSGSKTSPFKVTITEELEGVAPHLPGRHSPKPCADGGCSKDPPSCGAAESAGPPPETPGATAESAEFARVWFGISGNAGFAFRSGGADVCANTLFTCTNPDGTDFPTPTEVSTLGPGRAGHADGGLSTSAIRVTFAFDVAATRNLLLGARIGYVFDTYSGHQAQKVLGVPLHLEARAAWVFGSSPLSRVGFAPLVMVAFGTTRIDAKTTTVVTRTGIPGQRPEDVWSLGGPLFFGVGPGLRYGFSQRWAFTSVLRLDTALLGAGVVPALGVEATVQYGF